MSQDKDFSLLRPFDLEKAKAGEAICYLYTGELLEFLADAGPDGIYGLRSIRGNVCVLPGSSIRMSPLCWVEGKPVYKGDVLYRKSGRGFGELKVKDYKEHLVGPVLVFDDDTWGVIDAYTWTPPKVKREGWIVIVESDEPFCNIHPGGAVALKFLYKTEEIARRNNPNALAIIHGEWEVPAEVAK